MSLSKPAIFAIFALLAVVWFGNLDYRKLVRPDEGRYAEIPREMTQTGDWVTPRLNGIKYFEKPALQYWATAFFYTLFGEHQWTARLWSALTGFLGILMIFYAGKEVFGFEAGLYASLVLAGSLLYSAIGHINTLDMGVTFFMSSAMAAFLLAQRKEASEAQRRFWMHVLWAAMGLSVLSKGLIGVVLPGAVLFIYTLIERDWKLWTRLHFFTGIPLFLLICAPWFISVSKANPEFFHFFFIHEHLERFTTKSHGRFHPWTYFIPILFLGLLPWAITFVETFLSSWKKENAGFQSRRFLLIWTVFIYAFFSLSDSKLPSYILPIFPAIALLIGERLGTIGKDRLFWQIFPMAAIGFLGLVFAPKVVDFADKEVPLELYQNYVPWIYAASFFFLAGSLISLYLIKQNSIKNSVVILSMSSLFSTQLIMSGHDSLSPANSSYHLVEKIKPYLRAAAPFYSVGIYEQTLPFYIKQTVTLVAYQDEMAFGLGQEPDLWIPDIKKFEEIWKKQPYALAIMPPSLFDDLSKRLPMTLLARDTRRVVVRTP